MISANKSITKRLVPIAIPIRTFQPKETNISALFFCRRLATVEGRHGVSNLCERILKQTDFKISNKRKISNENITNSSNVTNSSNSSINNISSKGLEKEKKKEKEKEKGKEKEKEKQVYKTNHSCFILKKKKEHFCKIYLIPPKRSFSQYVKNKETVNNSKIGGSNIKKKNDIFYEKYISSTEMYHEKDEKENTDNNRSIIENKENTEITNGWKNCVEMKNRNDENEKVTKRNNNNSNNNNNDNNSTTDCSISSNVFNNSMNSQGTNNGVEETNIRYKEKYIFEKFSIFSFNILANSLVDEKYDKNNSDVMEWINRKKSIFLNIVKKEADIICLQEVEEEYFNELKIELEKKNYKGMFFKKKKEFCKDGLCIFYNCRVFQLLFFDEIVYDKTDILKKWQVGLIVALKNLKTKKFHKEKTKGTDNTNEIVVTDSNSSCGSTDSIGNADSDDILIVGNTHLAFDSFKGDVKLYQLCYLTYRIIIMLNKCANYIKSKSGNSDALDGQDILKPGIVLCGDFNLTPNSLLYYYVINRFINLKNINLELLSGQYLMFQKELYFNYCKQGKQMKNLFDENIITDLQRAPNKKSTENIRKELLFYFFKNKNILKEEYITNMLQTEKNGLIDYDIFEHIFASKKYAKDANKTLLMPISGSHIDEKETEKKSKHNCHIFNIEEEKKEKDLSQKTKNVSIKEAENETQEQEDLILYYPLYFKSVYNTMCNERRKEESHYKYDTMEHLLNNKNNEIEKNIPFTVFHGKQKGCVDYIFYSYKNLDMVNYSELPSFEALSKWGCLPNEKYPSSDHLYLHATLIRKK